MNRQPAPPDEQFGGRAVFSFLASWLLVAINFVAAVLLLRGLAGAIAPLSEFPFSLVMLALIAAITLAYALFASHVTSATPLLQRFSPRLLPGTAPLLCCALLLAPPTIAGRYVLLPAYVFGGIAAFAFAPETAATLRGWLSNLVLLMRSLTAGPLDQAPQQRWQREQQAGNDTLTGYCIAQFAAGERVAYLHLPFCPPFATVPQVVGRVTQPFGGIRVKPAAVYPHGARLELRRDDAIAAPLLAEVQVICSCTTGTATPHP